MTQPRAGGTTPINALPYPGPGDPVAQGAANIQALATKLDPLVIPPSYRIRNSTASIAISNNVWTILTLAAGEESFAGTDLATSGHGLLVNRAGLYQVDLMVTWGTIFSGVLGLIGVGSLSVVPSAFYRSSGPGQNQTGSWPMTFAAGDTIYGYVSQASGAAVNVTSRRIAARRIG
jgi:hypothetical protein